MAASDERPEDAGSGGRPGREGGDAGPALTCDICGCAELHWLRCKLVCRNCRGIVMSCADL